MRIGWGILALCGCNQVFGLHETQATPPIDAQYFDAPTDAPFTCPPPGVVPRFSRILHQIPQDCREYNMSAATGWAVAMCNEPAHQISQGAVDDALTPIAGLEATLPVQMDQPRLAPEGDELFFRYYNQMMVLPQIRVYHPGADHSWTPDHTLSPTLSPYVLLGTPTRGPVRRMMIMNGDNAATEIEIDASGAWTVVHAYSAAELGLDYMLQAPNLSPDGLRVVFTGPIGGEFKPLYGDRPSIAELFTTFAPVVGVPAAYDIYLTEDCARVYFSAASSLLFVQRE